MNENEVTNSGPFRHNIPQEKLQYSRFLPINDRNPSLQTITDWFCANSRFSTVQNNGKQAIWTYGENSSCKYEYILSIEHKNNEIVKKKKNRTAKKLEINKNCTRNKNQKMFDRLKLIQLTHKPIHTAAKESTIFSVDPRLSSSVSQLSPPSQKTPKSVEVRWSSSKSVSRIHALDDRLRNQQIRRLYN
jgi:hypothetical protein